MDGNIGGRSYHHEDEMEFAEEEWRQERMTAPTKIYNAFCAPRSTVRIATHTGTIRKFPLVIRKVPSSHTRLIAAQQSSLVRQAVRMAKVHTNLGLPSCSRMESQSPPSSDVPSLLPYASEETVRTSDEGCEELQDDMKRLQRLEEDLEVDVESASEGPSTSMMPKMVVRPKTVSIFHPADHKAVIENQQLKARLATVIDSNCRFRDDITQLREEKRELMKQLRRQERIIEKQAMVLAEAESALAEFRRKEKEKDKKIERELAIRNKKRKTTMLMPTLPNRKVVFSKATKQAQSLRLRLLNRYLTELCGPVEEECRLEEKNLIVLRWRKAHAPKPSLEIGRQLLPEEEEEFCKKFGIIGEQKKAMKRWLGKKHIDLFGPSERAVAVRKWRMGQREKKRRGEQVTEKALDLDESAMEEAGNDSDDEELMDDIDSALEDEESAEVEEKRPAIDGMEEEEIVEEEVSNVPMLSREEIVHTRR